MRYIINNELRELLWLHRKALAKTGLRSNLKNLRLTNKSISEIHLRILLYALKRTEGSLKLESYVQDYVRNFKGICGKGFLLPTEQVSFKGASPEFAEFIGILLGDGCISGSSVEITINSEEGTFGNYIIGLFSFIFGLRAHKYYSKTSKALRIKKCSLKLKQLLLSYGFQEGEKVKNNVGIPKWIKENREYSKACLRGLIDTDGCVYWHKRDKKMYLSFWSNCSNLLADFKECATKLGIKFVYNTPQEIAVYRKDDVKRFINEIGFSNQKHRDKVKKYSGAVG